MLEIDILPASKETKGADAILLRFGVVSGQLKPARNGHFLKPKTSHPV